MATAMRAPGPGLRVGHLRLRAADAVQAGRGARRIEDALRCASLPDRGATLLLVRRLALGRIAADASTQTLALRIESRLRSVTRWHQGTAADDDPHAEAVWFTDRVQALAALALRLAEQRPVQAWYWSRLLQPSSTGAVDVPTLAATLQALAREAVAPVALPALVATLLQRVERRVLLGLFTPPAAAALLHDAGIASVDAPLDTATRAKTGTGSGTDWIAALQAHDAAMPSHGNDRVYAPASPDVPMAAWADRPAVAPTALPAAVPAGSNPVQAPAPTTPATMPLPFDITLPTLAGGALFLLPVLARLGFAAEGYPALAARVIGRALERLQVPADDPLRALFTPRRAADADAATEVLAETWLDACRHALRRRFRIGLASLVLRPASVAATRSHVDVHFALAATDLRVRRHGFDLDPGWLPWFGRVVAFHFDR